MERVADTDLGRVALRRNVAKRAKHTLPCWLPDVVCLSSKQLFRRIRRHSGSVWFDFSFLVMWDHPPLARGTRETCDDGGGIRGGGSGGSGSDKLHCGFPRAITTGSSGDAVRRGTAAAAARLHEPRLVGGSSATGCCREHARRTDVLRARGAPHDKHGGPHKERSQPTWIAASSFVACA